MPCSCQIIIEIIPEIPLVKKIYFLKDNKTFNSVLNIQVFLRLSMAKQSYDSLFFSGGCRVVRWCLVNFQFLGVLLIWIIVWQGPIALAVGAGGVVWTFFLSSIISIFLLPLSGSRPDIH